MPRSFHWKIIIVKTQPRVIDLNDIQNLRNNIQNLFTILQESLPRAFLGHLTLPLRHESSRRERHSTFDRCRAARVALALFQDPLHRVFFGCCTTEGAQNYYSALIISRDLSARTSLCWACVLRKNVTAPVLLTFIGNVNKPLKYLKRCS